MLGLWDGEFLCIDDAIKFIKIAKQQLSIPVFGNFKEDSDRVKQWIMIAKRLEDAGADALVTFFTFIKENDQIDYPDCYAAVDESKCNGCEQCLPPAHCNAIVMDNSYAKINRKLCVGCCVYKYLCPENAIDMKLEQ